MHVEVQVVVVGARATGNVQVVFGVEIDDGMPIAYVLGFGVVAPDVKKRMPLGGHVLPQGFAFGPDAPATGTAAVRCCISPFLDRNGCSGSGLVDHLHRRYHIAAIRVHTDRKGADHGEMHRYGRENKKERTN